MKIAYFTDSHIRTKTPSARSDKSFLNTIMAKLRYVFTWCRVNDITTILCAGDLGDSPTWGQSAILEFIKLKNEFQEIRLIVAPGNHDVYSEDVSTYTNTALGLLEEAQAIQVLHGGNYLRLSQDDESVAVYGFGFGELPTEELLSGKFVPRSEHTKAIALVHATIGPDDSFGWKAISKQNIKGFKIALFGDVHCGFPPYAFPSKTVAYSCGSLVRLTKPERERPVMFGVLDLSSETTEIRAITIPTDKELFNDDTTIIAEHCSDNIFKTIQEVENRPQESLEKLLVSLAKENGVSNEALSMVLGRVKHG